MHGKIPIQSSKLISSECIYMIHSDEKSLVAKTVRRPISGKQIGIKPLKAWIEINRKYKKDILADVMAMCQ